MAGKLGVYHLREFRGISSLQESSHFQTKLGLATNVLLRPWGGFKGCPKYERLWEVGSAATIAATMATLNPPSCIVSVNQGSSLNVYSVGVTAISQVDLAANTFDLANSFTEAEPVQISYWKNGVPTLAPLAVGTTYYIKNRTASTFQLSTTAGSSPIDLTGWTGDGSSFAQEFLTITRQTISASSTLNAFGNSFADGQIVQVTTTGGLMAPLALATNYYIRNRTASTVQLSTTPSGAIIPFTTAGAGVITLAPQATLTSSHGTVAVRVSKHGKNFLVLYDMVNDRCRGLFYMGDDGSYTGDVDLLNGPPTYEVLATGLHQTARWYGSRFGGQLMLGNGQDTPVCVQLNRTVAPGKWREAGNNERPATPVVTMVTPSSSTNVQAFWTIAGGGGAGQRAGSASLTFTANATNFPGSAGNNRIKVQIAYNAYASAISSTLTGSGTISDPYHYTLTTGPGATASSNNSLVSFVNTDSKIISVLTASTSASDNTADTGSWAVTFLAGGTGTGSSVGLSNRTVTVYARYWDPGQENLGYEGISSDISNALVIDALSAMDIEVAVAKDPGAGGGRFRYIRLYLQFGEDVEATWLLVDPDNPLDNTSTGTATKRIGSETLFGQVMYVDQHQPLESVHIVQCNGQMWRGGVRDFPERLYVSKPATEDEVAPEGANIDAYELLQAIGGAGGSRMTAMYSDDYRVHIHTSEGVSFIDPSNPLSQQRPALLAGAINASALTPWTGADQYYLGSDLQLYQFNSTRYGQRDSEFAAADAAAYIAERVDRDAVHATPERVFVFPDVTGQHLWMFLPALDGTLRGFAYDFLAKGIVGPFDYPKVYAACRMEPNRPEIVLADEDGNLFVWDTSAQNDHGDAFEDQAAFTAYPTPDTPPVGDAGYGNADFRGSAYRKAYVTELETGMIDLGNAAVRKQFLAVLFTRVANSRMLVELTITTKDGHTITRYYGDPVTLAGDRCSHRVDFSVLDTAVKVKFRVLSEEQKPWIIRDVQLLYRTAKGV